MSAAVLLGGSLQGLAKIVEEQAKGYRPHTHVGLVGASPRLSHFIAGHYHCRSAPLLVCETGSGATSAKSTPDDCLTLDKLQSVTFAMREKARLVAPKIIFTDHLPPVQFRFPRSKKRRIRNKWAARQENYRPSRDGFQLADGTTIFHTSMKPVFEALQEVQVGKFMSDFGLSKNLFV